jgi:hypothetical protein
METQMNRVNYDLIVNELLRSLDLGIEIFDKHHQDHAFFGPDYFREFRGAGFTVPRQLGKTGFLLDFVEREPNAVLVIRNDMMRDCMISNHENYRERKYPAGDRVLTYGDVKKQTAADVFKEYEIIVIDDVQYYFHFIRDTLYRYLFDKKRWKTKLLLVG